MKDALYKLIKRSSKDDLLRMSKKKCKHGHTVLAHPSCFIDQKSEPDRIGFFDIETSDLNAEKGVLFSYAIKDLDGGVTANVIIKDELLSTDQDKRIVSDCIEDIKKFDRLVGYYSSCFDLPFVRTRALYHGLDFPKWKEIWHTDLWNIVRKKLKLERNSMQRACDLLGIESKATRFEIKTWRRAIYGDRKALATVLQHNVEDVLSTEQLWNRIIEFANLTKSSI